ncbi:MAG: hypothetical protein WC139_07250 [Candidatus Kapaibacterium sp.]
MADKEIKIKLSIDGKEVTASITNADELLKKLKTTATDTKKAFAEWGMIVTGINQGIQIVSQTFSALKESMMMGAELEVLRANFKGTAEDMELFRKATAGTVKEGTLIQLSNQATGLGISMKQQALLFNVAEDAADSLGGTVEENFRAMVFSTEGLTKALKALGIQKGVYETVLDKLAAAEGDKLENFDDEAQKLLRINALLEVTGVKMSDVTGKTKDNADKLESLGVRAEEAEARLGKMLNNALIPVYDVLEETGFVGDTVITTFGEIGQAATIASPLVSLFAASLTAVQASAIRAYAALLPLVSLAVGLGVGTGMALDYFGRPGSKGGVANGEGVGVGDKGKANDPSVNALFNSGQMTYIKDGKFVTVDVTPDLPPLGKKGKAEKPKKGKKLTPYEKLRLEMDIARENLEWALAQSRANKETFDDILKNAPPKYTGTLGGVEVPDKPGAIGMDSSNKTFTDMTGQTRALSFWVYSANIGFQTLGRTMSNAFSKAMSQIKGVNSLLEIFLVDVGEAIGQLLIMQTIKGLFTLAFPAQGVASSFMTGFTALADGGIATRPTFAMIGEAGPEAVIPLRNLPSFAPQTVKVQFAPVEMKQRGMDMRGSINATERYLTRNR